MMDSFNMNNRRDYYKNSFCDCWEKRPELWKNDDVCDCGEDAGMINGKKLMEWLWEPPPTKSRRNVILSENKKQVILHPFVSGGSCIIRGNTPFVHDYHYYWEVKLLSETAMTNLMIGVGTKQVMMEESREWLSRLGSSAESYGLNYLGEAHHRNCKKMKSNFNGFCRGCIVGVRVDMWAGTLEYYINRKPQGILFRGLRRHKELFPMIFSNGLNIGIRLIYASSYRASLYVEASKILGLYVKEEVKKNLFPVGLQDTMDSTFWLLLPSDVDDTAGDWYSYLKLSQYSHTDRYHYLVSKYLANITPTCYQVLFIIFLAVTLHIDAY